MGQGWRTATYNPLRWPLASKEGNQMTSQYAWKITRDYLAEDGDDSPFASEVGVSGPENAPQELIDQLADGEGRKFRLRDDDGELYYEGLVVGSDDWDDLPGNPLHDFGMPSAGATLYEERINGKWQIIIG